MVKPTVSQLVETMKTKLLSQRVKSDATLCCPIGSVSFGTSLIVTPEGDHAALLDTEHIGEVVSVASRRAKLNPRKWVVKKRGSHVGELDQNLKLTFVVLHDDRVDEIHLIQSSGFITAKKEVS